jgi:hypothetical protein
VICSLKSDGHDGKEIAETLRYIANEEL